MKPDLCDVTATRRGEMSHCISEKEINKNIYRNGAGVIMKNVIEGENCRRV